MPLSRRSRDVNIIGLVTTLNKSLLKQGKRLLTSQRRHVPEEMDVSVRFYRLDTEAVTAAGTIALAFLTLVLAVGTLFLWLATKRLVRGAEKTAQAQLRAYVGVDAAAIEGFGTDAARIRITIKNAGQTPAHDLVSWMGIKISPFPLAEKLEPPRRHPRFARTARSER